jgi:Asp-tRNA(Asn)/Glu-tRNA(Gln) amidotransferase A subunit family amidase
VQSETPVDRRLVDDASQGAFAVAGITHRISQGVTTMRSAARYITLLAILTAGCGAPAPAATHAPTPSTAGAPGPVATTTPSVTPTRVAATGIAGSVQLPIEATIPELQAAMASGDLTSVELVGFYLARIAAYDDAGPSLNALIYVNPEAPDEAAALDAERSRSGPRGPLHGIPVVIKDNINTADMPTTAGSRALDGFRPTKDAFQVERLRKAGAIILAKANLTELAHGWETVSAVGGQTLNPYDLARDPGGSSGGTAVAVTANFASVGLGTDTCGSIRLPSGHSDLYGIRPTSGRSSRAGVIPFSSTLDTVGPMARNVADLAIMLDATSGRDPADPTTVPLETSFIDAVDPGGLKGRRIGVRPFHLATDMEGILRDALDEMAANGAEIIEMDLPAGPNSEQQFFNESRFALQDYFAAEPTAPAGAMAAIDAWDPVFASVSTLDTDAYREAVAGRDVFRKAVVTVMDELHLDAVAYPVSPATASSVGSPQEHWDCATAAVAGAPALVVPAGFSSSGLPAGLELLGRPFDESTLISIAAGYEAHTNVRTLPPTTPPLAVGP